MGTGVQIKPVLQATLLGQQIRTASIQAQFRVSDCDREMLSCTRTVPELPLILREWIDLPLGDHWKWGDFDFFP